MVSGAASRVVYSADGANRTGATVGVVVTGETPYSEGCGDIPTPVGGTACLSRPTTLDLPSADVSKLMAYKSAGLKTVLVLVVGRPMILSDAAQRGRGRDHRRVAAGQRGRRRRRRPVRRLQPEGQAAAHLAAHAGADPDQHG